MLDRGNNVSKYTGPGHWNDYDMLIVGLDGESDQLVGTGASNVEYRTHFSIWSLVSSPLLIGSDVRTLNNDSLETLTNKEIIAVNQDPDGSPHDLVQGTSSSDQQIYAKQMHDGSIVVALLNRGSQTADMTISPRRDLTAPWDLYRLRDLWKHKDHGPYDIPYTTEVMPHEAKMLRLSEAIDTQKLRRSARRESISD